MVRYWISGPRLFGNLIRPGISFSKADFEPPRLPAYRRYELRKGLREAAKARGETMTRDDADYCINKALATGVLDAAGELHFNMRGSREEIIAEILQKSAAWGMPMDRAEAERLTDRAIRDPWPRRVLILILAAVLIAVLAAH